MAVLVKTLQGLAYASVKVRNGLAVASIKSINGLDATGGSLANLSDLFTRPNDASLGAAWTQHVSAWGINSNAANMSTSGGNATYNTGANTLTNYQRIALVIDSLAYPAMIFRFTNSTSSFYRVQFQQSEDMVSWTFRPNVTDAGSAIGTSALTVATGDVFGATLAGTGTGTTVLRIWRNPTATIPVSSTEWDSGDTTPDVTITNSTANIVDTGSLGGIQATGNSTVQITDWYYGDTT